MTSFKKTCLGLAVAATTGLGLAGPASADVFSQGVLQVTNFRFLEGATTTLVDLSDFQVLIFSDSANHTATLRGTNSSDGLVQAFFGTLDLAQNCVGACAAQNDFTHHPAGLAAEVARSDSLLTGSPISGTGQPTGANASTVSEAQLIAAASAGTATVGTTLGLVASFQFTLNNPLAVTIAFAADNFLRALVNAPAGSTSQATSSWSINIVDANNANVFTWAPNGEAGGISGLAGTTENSDPCSLNTTIGASILTPSSTHTCVGAFSATTAVLAAQTSYTLTLTHTNTSAVTQLATVPEPATMALLGASLLGLGFGARRRSKAS